MIVHRNGVHEISVANVKYYSFLWFMFERQTTSDKILKKMKNKFWIFECRGYGIEYEKKASTSYNEAVEVANNLAQRGEVNGNGDPFTYEVRLKSGKVIYIV